MLKKTLIPLIIFYLLVLVQTSFLVHFRIMGWTPNLVLFSVIIWNLLEKRKNYSGVFGAFFGGFLSDIFSNRFIGFNILILIGSAIFIKFILKKYVQIS